MSSNKLAGFIIFILLFGGIYAFFRLHACNKTNNYLSEKLIKSNYWEELNYFKTNEAVQIENGNLCLIDSLNSMGALKSTFLGKRMYLFVCRFSQNSCSSCLEYVIKVLKHSSKYLKKEDIVLLNDYKNNRILQRELRLCGVDSSFQSLNIERINLPAEDMGYPYFFVLDRDLRVLSISVPNKATFQLDFNYIKLVGNRYFKKEKDVW